METGLKRIGQLGMAGPFSSALVEQIETRWRNPHDRAVVAMLRFDEPAIIRILPDWEPGAGGTPGSHHLFIGSLAAAQPVQKIQDQRFHCVHNGFNISTGPPEPIMK